MTDVKLVRALLDRHTRFQAGQETRVLVSEQLLHSASGNEQRGLAILEAISEGVPFILASASAQPGRSGTILHACARSGSSELAIQIARHSVVDLEARDADQHTALAVAVLAAATAEPARAKKFEEIAIILVNSGAKWEKEPVTRKKDAHGGTERLWLTAFVKKNKTRCPSLAICA